MFSAYRPVFWVVVLTETRDDLSDLTLPADPSTAAGSSAIPEQAVERSSELSTPKRTPRHVIVGWVGLIAVTVVVLFITLWPEQVDNGKSGMVKAVLKALHTLGVPDTFKYRHLEFVSNIIMFVPLGYFLGLIIKRWWWLIAFAVPPILSAIVETSQLLFLPARVPSALDVLANTMGGWIGIALAALTRVIMLLVAQQRMRAKRRLQARTIARVHSAAQAAEAADSSVS